MNKLYIALVTLFFATCTLATDSTVTPYIPSEENYAWKCISDLKNQFDNDQKGYSAPLNNACLQYVMRYTYDYRTPQACLFLMESEESWGAYPFSTGVPEFHKKIAQIILDHPSSTIEQRLQAKAIIAGADYQELKLPSESSTSTLSADQLINKVEAYSRTHPDTPATVASVCRQLFDYLARTTPDKLVAFRDEIQRTGNSYSTGLINGWLNRFNLHSQALNLSLVKSDGTTITLSSLRGSPVIVDVWASWCGNCVAILPFLKSLYSDYHSQGLQIVGVSDDKDADAAKAAIKGDNITWPMDVEALHGKQTFKTEYGVDFIPLVWILDDKGKLVGEYDGNLQSSAALQSQFIAQIKTLLATKQASK